MAPVGQYGLSLVFDLMRTGSLKKVFPRLPELAPVARDSQDAKSRNLGQAFWRDSVVDGSLTYSVLEDAFFLASPLWGNTELDSPA